MSVYNGERFLQKSIEFILGQTFSDFEFLIINYGSTDNSRDIILSFHDPRIRLIDNPSNIRLTKSLNRRLKLTESEFIVRQDADDISYPERLKQQVQFFYDHPDLASLCWVQGHWLLMRMENHGKMIYYAYRSGYLPFAGI